MHSRPQGQNMAATPSSDSFTQLLVAANRGNRSAVERLWTAVNDELHELARGQLAREGRRAALQTASLVNQAYLRMVGNEPVEWANRRHFYAAAAETMRRIRVDRARERKRLKRGGDRGPQPLLEDPIGEDADPAEMLAVDEALTRLKQCDPRKADVVMLRYFAGRTVDETAAALDLSPRTVDAEWRFARAWLHRALACATSAVDASESDRGS